MLLTTAKPLVLCLSGLAMLATAAQAQGVVQIDQKDALQGRVTPGDTPGFPITISQRGSYRLMSNLVVPDPSTTAIQITADDVALDLNGFSIVGPNVCTPNPVRCTFTGGGIGVMAVAASGPSPANVRVRNGVVRGMGGHGIRMMGDGARVENVQSVMNGGPGIVVGEGSVVDSVAKLNGSGTAIVGSIVRNCVAAQNVFGIFVRPGGVATGNMAYGNSGGGISITNASASGNTAMDNATYGFDAVCPGTLVGNTAHRNQVNFRTNGLCVLADNAQ